MWPRIKKNGIDAKKYLEQIQINPTCPLYFLQSRHGHFIVVQTLFLFWKIDVFSSVIESGTRSHIFGSMEEKLTSIMDCEICLPFKTWWISKILAFISKVKQRIYGLWRDPVSSLKNFSLQRFINFYTYANGFVFF